MLSHIEFFITYTVEAIMLFYLGQNIFEPTKSSNWRIGYLAFSHGIMMLICPLHILWVNMGAYFSVSVIYFLFFHEREIWKSFFFGIFTVVTEALAEMFAVGVITIATPDYRIFQPPLEAIHYREIEGALLACVLYAFLCCLIIRIQGKKRIKEENRSFWMLFFASMLVSVVAVEVVISRVLFEEELGRGKLLVFMTVFVILAEVIMVVGLRNAAEKSNVERELLQLSQRESEQAEYYRLLSEQYERRSLLIHDIKNHLIAIR